MSEQEQRIVEQVTAALEQSVAELDGATRSRLAQARARALQERRPRMRLWWVPAAGAVFATVLVAVLWLGRPAPAPSGGAEPQDFDMLTSNDNLELLQNLDFYQWLDEQEAHHAG